MFENILGTYIENYLTARYSGWYRATWMPSNKYYSLVTHLLIFTQSDSVTESVDPPLIAARDDSVLQFRSVSNPMVAQHSALRDLRPCAEGYKTRESYP